MVAEGIAIAGRGGGRRGNRRHPVWQTLRADPARQAQVIFGRGQAFRRQAARDLAAGSPVRVEGTVLMCLPLLLTGFSPNITEANEGDKEPFSRLDFGCWQRHPLHQDEQICEHGVQPAYKVLRARWRPKEGGEHQA